MITLLLTNFEFLSARFVHPGALQLPILSFFNTSYDIRIMEGNKLLLTLLFDYNNIRAFEVLI